MQKNSGTLAPEKAFFVYDRCQRRECPLTGIDNCNHSVRPGCIVYGKSINIQNLDPDILLNGNLRRGTTARCSNNNVAPK